MNNQNEIKDPYACNFFNKFARLSFSSEFDHVATLMYNFPLDIIENRYNRTSNSILIRSYLFISLKCDVCLSPD